MRGMFGKKALQVIPLLGGLTERMVNSLRCLRKCKKCGKYLTVWMLTNETNGLYRLICEDCGIAHALYRGAIPPDYDLNTEPNMLTISDGYIGKFKMQLILSEFFPCSLTELRKLKKLCISRAWNPGEVIDSLKAYLEGRLKDAEGREKESFTKCLQLMEKW